MRQQLVNPQHSIFENLPDKPSQMTERPESTEDQISLIYFFLLSGQKIMGIFSLELYQPGFVPAFQKRNHQSA